MKKILLNIVETSTDVLFLGDVFLERNRKDLYQLFTICPGCDLKIASMDSNDFSFKTKTYSKSIIHDKNLGGCGWNGQLLNGFFEELQEI